MAVALRPGKSNKLEDTFKDFNQFEWHSCKAKLVLWKHPKQADQPTGAEHGNDVTRTSRKEDDEEEEVLNTNQTNLNATDVEKRQQIDIQ